ncbi:MAG: OmpP1/FadL family transporter [Verrucomicrobiota bacterium]
MRIQLSLSLLLTASAALATDGYFDHGYGVKAKGLGGAGVAFAQDSMVVATNPAGLVDVADSHQVGLTWFAPERSVTVGGNTFDGNEDGSFYIPDFSYKTTLSSGVAFGLAVFGNGGMNTGYQTALFNVNPGVASSNTSMDLSQLFIAPTWSWRNEGGHTFGVSAILAGQRFKATGLEDFGINNAGYDTSVGGGARLGWTWQASRNLKVGATYQSRLWMSKFDKYAGLFAEQGGFDIPSNYALGFAYKIDSSLTWAFDVERIHYSEVNSVGNPGVIVAPFGAANGPGFGWKDVTVIKTGLAYEVSPTLVVRLGYNHTTQPIGSSEIFFNQLAPGVVRHHATLGATWQANASTEVSFFYARAFNETVSGNIGGPASLQMDQDSFGLSLNWKH